MTIAFPAIRPTSRRYQLPAFPVTQFKSQGGITSFRLWGSNPEGARLQLEFQNISDVKALAIAEAYASAKGSIGTLDLPPEIFSGADARLADFIKSKGNELSWRFAQEPPVIESVVNGVSSVSIVLIGILTY